MISKIFKKIDCGKTCGIYLIALGTLSIFSMLFKGISLNRLEFDLSPLLFFWAGFHLIKHNNTARKWVIGFSTFFVIIKRHKNIPALITLILFSAVMLLSSTRLAANALRPSHQRRRRNRIRSKRSEAALPASRFLATRRRPNWLSAQPAAISTVQQEVILLAGLRPSARA